MISKNTKITELTWGDILTDLDERYGQKKGVQPTLLQSNSFATEFINIKECSLLTGYTPGYIRQLVFKRAIPFHKNPKLKPLRFKRTEILEWMTTKKFTPIQEQADNYIENNYSFTKDKRKNHE